MKLKNSTSVFNMGDTSFRRKTLMDDYKELLVILREHKKKYPKWEGNNEAQGFFYNTVMDNTELFNRQATEDSSKRGRTLTNALIKPGLINARRELGSAAIDWIDGKSKTQDSLERLMVLSIANIVFLRQWFKLKVFDADGKRFFYPFRFALKFLSIHKNVPENDLLIILHSINLDMCENELNNLINNYSLVVQNQQIFEEYINENLPAYRDDEDMEKARYMFKSEVASRNTFYELFPNRKSSAKQKIYYDFYLAVNSYKKMPNKYNLEQMVDISKNPAIKKAFGFNSIPFNIPSGVSFTPDEFEHLNFGNPLLDENPIKFYTQFVNSKKADLIREYSDMTKRSFNLSGIFSFESGLVNLVQPWLIVKLFKYTEISIVGLGDASSYEGNIDSIFYQDITLMEILGLENSQLDFIETEILKEFGVSDVIKLTQFIEDEKEQDFRKMVDKEFTRSKTVDLLRLFIDRTPKNDREIQSIVSDSATIPTIFEYVLAVAWYHISDKDYSIRKSLNLSLDGNFKPLTHAAGGDGDIVIKRPQMTLMLEATLMNKNAQKRGELEPVIRHATNLANRSNNDEVLTIFVADELDNNVINIFRAVSYVELESTQERGKHIKGINIFSLTIKEVSELIVKNVDHNHILNSIKNEFDISKKFTKIGWRDKVVENIFE